MSELKPCPFCGETKVIRPIGGRIIRCYNCGCGTSLRNTPDDSVNAWNTRHERTCHAVTEVLESVDIGIGHLDRLIDNCSECGEPLTADYSQNTPERAVLPNYCYNCGAKVVSE